MHEQANTRKSDQGNGGLMSQPRSQTSAVAPTDQVRAHELTEAAHCTISKLAEGGQSGTSHAIPGDNTGTDDRRIGQSRAWSKL
jgi:hypothetical protein